jgi:hypothetical protein
MSYDDWNNSGYNNVTQNTYGNLDSSYPKPFQNTNNNYKNRDNWNFLPDHNIRQHPVNFDANYKVLDDSQFRRSDIPTYHTLPGKDTHVVPFSHVMKRSAKDDNSYDKYNDIFGNNRMYNKSNPSNPSNAYDLNQVQYTHQQTYSQNSQNTSQPRVNPITTNNNYHPQGGPKMKLLGDDIGEVEPIQHSGDHERRKVYNAILEYFPGFELIKSGNYNGYGVYKAIVQCLLCTGVRYIVAIVKNDPYSVGTVRPLSLLKWESFQTRFAEDDKDFQQFNYGTFAYEKPKETILDDKISIASRGKSSYVYNCNNLPLNIEILKSKEHEDLSDYGTVSSALELFQTVLTFTR